MGRKGTAIGVFNWKGGVTKSSVVEYFVRYFGWYGAEYDSTGVLAERNPDLVTYVDIEDNFVVEEGKKFIFDMGGYKDHRVAHVINQLNLLIVPYTVLGPDLDVTMTMISDLFKMHTKGEIDLTLTPVIFCPTLFDAKLKGRVNLANETMQDIFDMMPDDIQVDFFPLPFSNAMIMSRQYNCSIWDIVNSKKPYEEFKLVTAKGYKKEAERYDAFVAKIGEYV